MPSREILERRIELDAHILHGEIDRDFGGDVRDGEAMGRDERRFADLLVEPLKMLFSGLALSRAILRKLFEDRLEQFVQMLERAAGRGKKTKLDPPIPHFDDRLLAAVLAHQVGLRMQPFKVTADG